MEIKTLQHWIQKHFHIDDFTLLKLDKGFSNDNYLLCIGSEKFVVRSPREDHALLSLQFKHEHQVISKVQEIDVPCVFFDIETGIKITKYIDPVWEFNDFKQEDKYKKVGLLLKKMHSLKKVPFYFYPYKKMKTYKQNCTNIFVHFDKEEETISQFLSIYQPNTLCHNDLVSGNLLFNNHKCYLIDHEYAATNDYRFDIASFFSENQILDSNNRNQFYQGYFENIPDSIEEEVLCFEKMEDILWGYWANMLYNQRHEEIYMQIANDKVNHYKKINRR